MARKRLCAIAEVPAEDAAVFDLDGVPVLITRLNDEYFAIADTCSHAEASLSEGYFDPDECTVECPLHNAVFSLKTGEALEFPADAPVAAFKVTVEGADVFVEPVETS